MERGRLPVSEIPQNCDTCALNYKTCGHNKGKPRRVHPGNYCRFPWVPKLELVEKASNYQQVTKGEKQA